MLLGMACNRACVLGNPDASSPIYIANISIIDL
jgi:hypothetical protein